MTRRDGFICDECGDEHNWDEPPAVEKIDGVWKELCEDCYDEWWAENMEEAEA
jgi:hypothetical protein